jgi:UMF1 family MFS transporter
VAPARKIGQVSGLGVSLGYVGAIIGMLLVLPFVKGKIFDGTGNQQAFIPTAVFFLLFSIPTFLWVKEKYVSHPAKIKIKQSFKEVWDGLANTKKYPGVLRFLVSNFFFGDAIATVILFMAVYAQLVMGFSETGKIWLFMVSTLSAAIGSLLCGWVCDKIGPKKTLSLVLLGWFFSLLLVIFITSKIWFWILGSIVGILLGSVWTASRPLLTDLVPKSKMGQFFSLYSLFGRVAAIVGPLIWGLVVLYFKKDFFLVQKVVSFLRSIGIEVSQSVLSTIQYRFAIFSLALMMLVGWWILLKVPNKFEKG